MRGIQRHDEEGTVFRGELVGGLDIFYGGGLELNFGIEPGRLLIVVIRFLWVNGTYISDH